MTGVLSLPRTALAAAGIEPLELTAKEGLALINGTDGMLGMLVMAVSDLERLLRTADVAAAMSVEALLGTDRAFAEDLIALRPQPGQVDSAWNLRTLLAGSEIVASPSLRRPPGPGRVLAAMRAASDRCGARRAGVRLAASPSVELRSAIDNPMVLPDGRVESCGNFHGAPVGHGLRLPGDRRGGGGRDRRAAHRPAARCFSVPRPARVPGR